MGRDHGRDRHCDRAADRADADLPESHHLGPDGRRLHPEVPHMAQLLREAGYRTTLVGMQHLIDSGSASELGYERVLPVAPAYDEACATVSLLRELARSDEPFYLEVGFEEPHR